ncbi:MAG: hypothetical protein ACYS15_05645 [Planctomycetota bacterium]
MSAGCLSCRVGAGLAVGAALMLGAEANGLNTCPADTNGDALVDVVDALNVIGNWGVGPFNPPGSDTNQDGVVDVIDFLRVIGDWGPCPSPGPHLVGYANSGCLPEGGGASPPCAADDSFAFVVEGDRLTITHFDATYNCCPDDIEVVLEVGEWLLVLTETEILGMPCDCVCCFNVESAVEGLTPGEYTVEYTWWDYETGGERCYTDVVVIPGDPV